MNQENLPGDADQVSETNDKTELTEQALDQVNGGLIGLLLPAVQKVREPSIQEAGDPHLKGINLKAK